MEKRRQRGDLITVFKPPQAGYMEDGCTPVSVPAEDRMRSLGLKSQQGNLGGRFGGTSSSRAGPRAGTGCPRRWAGKANTCMDGAGVVKGDAEDATHHDLGHNTSFSR